MKTINFSAVEILPALLSRMKTQTIRPARRIIKIPKMGITHLKGIPIEMEKKTILKAPKYEVGDKVQMMWHQRTSPKGTTFCQRCGLSLNPRRQCECKPIDKLGLNIYPMFSKVLGTATITEVVKLKLELRNTLRFGKQYIATINGMEFDGEYLAEQDGFSSTMDFFVYFDENYDLSEPKEFWVYRWMWNK